MKAIVFVSSVQNPEEPLRCTSGQLQAIPDNTMINDFDLIAVEKAVQLKENGDLDEVILFHMGPDKSILQKPLAMGADGAIFVESELRVLTSNDVVETALSVIPRETDDIWMLGKTGVNFESHQTAQRLASLLKVPCVMSAFEIAREQENWLISCEDDLGIPTYCIKAPFVVTADLRLAEPRFPSLPNLIRAKKKNIQESSQTVTQKEPSVVTLAREGRRSCQFIEQERFLSMILSSGGCPFLSSQ